MTFIISIEGNIGKDDNDKDIGESKYSSRSAYKYLEKDTYT